MPGGKPRYYATVEALQAAGDAYFEACDAKEIPYTITGLALGLGFTSRQDLINYEGYGKEYHDTIRLFKLRCEACAQIIALTKPNQVGAIFVLKNHGWSDQQHVELSGPGGGGIMVHVSKYVKSNADTEEGEDSGS